jgi:F-type H+-transporting ATPase subunit delta
MASVTSRYARAFADAVIELGLEPIQVRQELRGMVEMVGQNPQLRRVWENPAVEAEQKHSLLDAIAQRAGLVTAVRNMVAVLIDHERIGMLARIASQFEQELNQRLGLTDAKITSARELDAEERAALEREIEKLTGNKVLAHYHTDAEVLGGAIIRLGSTIYDGSVRGQLRLIQEQLSS